MTVLLIAEHDNSELRDSNAKVVTAALEMDSDVHVLVAGHNCAAVGDAAAKLEGIAKVIVVDDPQFERPVAENMATLIVPMMESYEHLVSAANTDGKDYTPRIAALMDVAQVSEITAVKSSDTFERPIYAGNAIETVQATDAKKVVTVRTTTFAAVGEGGSAPVESASAPESPGIARYKGEELSKSDRPELTSAKIVISGGRGMQSGDNFPMLEAIADKLGAAVGASRAAVDAGFVPNDYQVGQTGKVVAPQLYVAVGISGAIQHLAGMKDSKVIVAINKDEEAPIFQVADYGLVADLFQAVPELEAELAKAGY